jgi:hypothetical protein
MNTTINNPDPALYADLVKGARNSWLTIAGTSNLTSLDSNGWPLSDGQYVFQESLLGGLSVDPIMVGQCAFSFIGKATPSVRGNCKLGYWEYDKSTNTTLGDIEVFDNKWNASYFIFTNSVGGIKNLQIMKPIKPGAAVHYPLGTLFDTIVLNAYSSGPYNTLRFQRIGNNEVQWLDRTLPSFFNQKGGKQTTSPYPIATNRAINTSAYPDITNRVIYSWNGAGVVSSTSNGPSWEICIAFANATNKNLHLSVPPLASDDYFTKLIQTILYGSDGINPYTSHQSNPTWAPLNPSLTVLFEMGNELWNTAYPFYQDYWNTLSQATHEYNNGTLLGKLIGSVNQGRWIIARLIQWSEIIRNIAPTQINTRLKIAFFYQYDNINNTASGPLVWAESTFSQIPGPATISPPLGITPRPIPDYLHAAGGASYYTANNPDGCTDIQPQITYTNLAGKTTYNGEVVSYISNNSTINLTFIAPETQVSNNYCLLFTALNSIGGNLSIKVFKVQTSTTAINIGQPTYSQPIPYIPLQGNGTDWSAQLVSWTKSHYYASKPFTATPGETISIFIQGADLSTGSGTVYFKDFILGSVDEIYNSGCPNNTTSSAISTILRGESLWAILYGLIPTCYEGGCGLGGDDGGTGIQNLFRYADSRAITSQQQLGIIAQQAGIQQNAQGTYETWPTWSDPQATQGFITGINNYPLVNGTITTPTVFPTNGIFLPSNLTEMNAEVGYNWHGPWMGWIVISSSQKIYTISVHSPVGYTLLIDGVVCNSNTITLSAGIHGIRLFTSNSDSYISLT